MNDPIARKRDNIGANGFPMGRFTPWRSSWLAADRRPIQCASWSLASGRSRSVDAQTTLTGSLSGFARTFRGGSCEGARRPLRASQHSPKSIRPSPLNKAGLAITLRNRRTRGGGASQYGPRAAIRRTSTVQAARDLESWKSHGKPPVPRYRIQPA